MKKLLNVLGAVLILGSSTTAVAACGGKPKGNDDANLTDLQKNMLSGAEFMTKVILAGRHENLNYNVNEVLSTFMAPISTLSNMPLNYNYNGKAVDLASGVQNYKNVLAPQMSTWDQDNYAGFYASYVMGMYDNKFYQDYWNKDNGFFQDTINKDGGYGINQPGDNTNNADGFAAGLTSWDLSKDKERRQLAWGIQDTGPLTNYLLNNGLDGGYPDDSSGTANPNSPASEKTGGTNASGYLYYNSQVATSKGYLNGIFEDSNSYNNKLKNGIALKDQTDQLEHSLMSKSTNWTNAELNDGTKFGESGALFAKTGANLNINGYSTTYTGLLNMISESESGASILGKFLDGIFPILKDDGSSSSVQSVGYKLWSSPLVGLYTTKKVDGEQGYYNDGVLEILKKLDSSVNWAQFNTVKAPNAAVKPINAVFTNPEDADVAANLIDQICSSFEKASAETQKDFYDQALSVTDMDGKYNYGILTKGMGSMVINKTTIPADAWTKIAGANNGRGGINLLHAVSRAVRATHTYKDQVDQVTEKYGKKQYKRLTTSERNDYLKILGWDGTKFKENSLLKDAYDTLKTETGSSEFSALLAEFANITSTQMKDPHEKLIQYIAGDDYWKDSDVKISVKDNKQTDGKMTFTLDYNGVGDSTSNADQQTTEIDPSEKFNPYQTIIEKQKDKMSDAANKMVKTDKISGKVLGVDQLKMNNDDLKAYDGTGMLNNMKPTHHQYKVSWENVGDSEHPYWVITSIHSFNDKGEEFYNIY
jgi:hypothetical protein